MIGRCFKSAEDCTFAHGKNDIIEYPFLKTRLCQYYANGYCQYSTDKCKYAHGKNDLRCVESAENPLPKTRLCQYHANGCCRFGDTCHFSHSFEKKNNAESDHKIVESSTSSSDPALYSLLKDRNDHDWPALKNSDKPANTTLSKNDNVTTRCTTPSKVVPNPGCDDKSRESNLALLRTMYKDQYTETEEMRVMFEAVFSSRALNMRLLESQITEIEMDIQASKDALSLDGPSADYPSTDDGLD